MTRPEWEDPADVEDELRENYGDALVDKWLTAAANRNVRWLAPWLRACEANHTEGESIGDRSAPSTRKDDSGNSRAAPAVASVETTATVVAYLRANYPHWSVADYKPVAERLIRYSLTDEEVREFESKYQGST